MQKGLRGFLHDGNTTPIADLMVVSPVKREMFLVDVKGMHRVNPWINLRRVIYG